MNLKNDNNNDKCYFKRYQLSGQKLIPIIT